MKLGVLIEWEEITKLAVQIWREKMNVGFAWSHVPKWCCLIAVMQCVSNATAIGMYKLLKTPFSLMFLSWILDVKSISIRFTHYNPFKITGTQSLNPALFVVVAWRELTQRTCGCLLVMMMLLIQKLFRRRTCCVSTSISTICQKITQMPSS